MSFWDKNFHILLYIVTFISICSCGTNSNLRKNINFELWISDKSGCLGLRELEFIKLDSLKSELYGIHEQKIFSLFGKPNKIQMEERNKKCYTYFLECDTMVLKRVLKIDFDGLDRVRIIRVAVE